MASATNENEGMKRARGRLAGEYIRARNEKRGERRERGTRVHIMRCDLALAFACISLSLIRVPRPSSLDYPADKRY